MKTNKNKNTTDCELAIRDEGCGIKAKTASQLFTPFSTDNKSHEKHYEGAGVGLSICNEQIKLMRGTIAVKHHEPGTEFILSVSLANSRPIVTKLKLKKQKQTNAYQPKNFTILITDDNGLNLMLLQSILEKSGYQVVTASSGEQAIAITNKQKIDFIFMDIIMPGMTGYQAAEGILKSNNIPIFALTANEKSAEQERVNNAGMQGILSKPYTKELILATIKKYLAVTPCSQNSSASHQQFQHQNRRQPTVSLTTMT